MNSKKHSIIHLMHCTISYRGSRLRDPSAWFNCDFPRHCACCRTLVAQVVYGERMRSVLKRLQEPAVRSARASGPRMKGVRSIYPDSVMRAFVGGPIWTRFAGGRNSEIGFSEVRIVFVGSLWTKHVGIDTDESRWGLGFCLKFESLLALRSAPAQRNVLVKNLKEFYQMVVGK